MALGMLLTNATYWDNLVLSTLKVSLLRTATIIPYKEIFNRQQENNAIVNNAVDEILLHESQKVSTAELAPAFLGSDYDDNELYQVEIMSLEETKEIRRALSAKLCACASASTAQNSQYAQLTHSATIKNRVSDLRRHTQINI